MDPLFSVVARVRADGAIDVRVTGELDILSAPELPQRVRALSATPPAGRTLWAVIDLTRLLFCDASGVRGLLAAIQELADRGAVVEMIAPASETVRRVLAITEVDRHVAAYGPTDPGDWRSLLHPRIPGHAAGHLTSFSN
jgi:anti-anti-sigma factor